MDRTEVAARQGENRAPVDARVPIELQQSPGTQEVIRVDCLPAGERFLEEVGHLQGGHTPRIGRRVDRLDLSGVTNVCRAGLRMVGEGRNATEEAVLAQVSTENSRMQYFISYLSVIGVCTPMK